MEPGNILWPICVTRDVTFRPSRLAGRDNAGEIGDSVGELSDGIMEFRGKVVRPELRDTTGKLTDMLGASDNKLDFGMAVGINVCDTSNELGRTMGREEGGVRVSPGSSLMRESDKLIEGALRLSVKEDNISPPSVEIDNDVDNPGKSTVIDDREGIVTCGSTLEIVVGRSVLRGGRAGNSEPEGSPVIVGRIGLSVICGEVSILTETGGINGLIKGDAGNDGDAVTKSIGLGINPEVRASASDDPRFEVGIPGKLKESLMGLNVGNDRTLLKELSVGNAGIDESKVVGNEGTSLKLGLGSPVKIPLGKDGSADALKMPVVNMVTVNGGGIQVTVTAPSQTA